MAVNEVAATAASWQLVGSDSNNKVPTLPTESSDKSNTTESSPEVPASKDDDDFKGPSAACIGVARTKANSEDTKSTKSERRGRDRGGAAGCAKALGREKSLSGLGRLGLVLDDLRGSGLFEARAQDARSDPDIDTDLWALKSDRRARRLDAICN